MSTFIVKIKKQVNSMFPVIQEFQVKRVCSSGSWSPQGECCPPTVWTELELQVQQCMVSLCWAIFSLSLLWPIAYVRDTAIPTVLTVKQEVFPFKNKLVYVESKSGMLASNWAGPDSSVL